MLYCLDMDTSLTQTSNPKKTKSETVNKLNIIANSKPIELLPDGSYFITNVRKRTTLIQIGTTWWRLPKEYNGFIDNATDLILTMTDTKLSFSMNTVVDIEALLSTIS